MARSRFAFEKPREEVERIEQETGRKVPRANHAFLFPGEPVLTAGAFFVALDPDPAHRGSQHALGDTIFIAMLHRPFGTISPAGRTNIF